MNISGSTPRKPTVNQDLMDEIKSIILEICMKVSTESQSDLLLMYATVIQSMFTNLKRSGLSENVISCLHQQFDFIIVVNTKSFSCVYQTFPSLQLFILFRNQWPNRSFLWVKTSILNVMMYCYYAAKQFSLNYFIIVNK